MTENKNLNSKQLLFQSLFVGTLLYSVVLGFFNDYTDILQTKSYSTTFAVAIVMQLLTYATFSLKDIVKVWFDGREGRASKVALVFSVWFILFISKFVFLGVIDLIFGDNVEISGFWGLFVVVIAFTVVQEFTAYFYKKLGSG